MISKSARQLINNIIILFITLFVSACSPNIYHMYKVPESTNSDLATFVIIREGGFLAGYKGTLYPTVRKKHLSKRGLPEQEPNKMICGLDAGEFVRFSLPQGDYVIGYAYPVEGVGGQGSNGFFDLLIISAYALSSGSPVYAHWNYQSLAIEARGKETYYLLIPNTFYHNLKQLKKEEAKKFLQSYKLIPTGTFPENLKNKTKVKILPEFKDAN